MRGHILALNYVNLHELIIFKRNKVTINTIFLFDLGQWGCLASGQSTEIMKLPFSPGGPRPPQMPDHCMGFLLAGYVASVGGAYMDVVQRKCSQQIQP